jgi:hypothetical protein
MIYLTTASTIYSAVPFFQNDLEGCFYWDTLVGGDGTPTIGYGADQFTLSAWVMPVSNSLGTLEPDKQTILVFGGQYIGNGGVYYGPEIHFYLITGSDADHRGLGFSGSQGPGSYPSENPEWTTVGDVINIAEWTHVAVSWNKYTNDVDFFINGVSVPVVTPAAGYLHSPAASTIIMSGAAIGNDFFDTGTARHGGHQFPFEGYISNVAMFTGSLTETQVNEMYNGGHPISLYEHSCRGQLLAWYPLGDGKGQRVGYDGNQILGETPMTPIERGIDAINESIYGLSDLGIGSVWNIMYDMIGNMHGIPTSSMTTTASIADLTVASLYTCLSARKNEEKSSYVPLLGRGQVREDGFADCFKVGALYSRKVPEYTSLPWPIVQITDFLEELVVPGATKIYDRSIHMTGSRIFAGDSEWSIPSDAGRNANYSRYEEYSEDVRVHGKGYTVVPEFRISEWMNFYVDDNGGDFYVENPGFLTLTGGYCSSSQEDGFFKTYTHTEFLKYFDMLEQQHEEVGEGVELTLKCSGILKLLPYEGFFPASRTLQLASLFSQSYGDYVKPYGYGDNSAKTGSWRAFLTPMFGPGVLYNSIKAGLAVDYPIYTSYPEIQQDMKAGTGYYDFVKYGLPNKPYRNADDELIDQWELFSREASQMIRKETRAIYGSSINALTSAYYAKVSQDPYSLADADYGEFATAPLATDQTAEFHSVLSSPFGLRVPFEGLVEPENYLAKGPIWDMEPDFSASLRENLFDASSNQAAFWGGEGLPLYKMAMHNFLAETDRKSVV